MKKNTEELIEDALKLEPAFRLGADFKDKVVMLIRKKERKALRRLYLLISFGIIFMLGAGYALMQYFSETAFFSQNGKLIPYAIIAGGLVALVQYLDKKLVKDKFLKQLA